MAAHVVPGPTVKAIFLDRRHVIGDEVIAEIISLVGGAPELACNGIDRFTHTVADARGIDLDELALGRVLEHVGAMELPGVSVSIVDIGSRTYGDEHVLAIFGKDYVACPMTAAGQLGVPRHIRDDGLWCSTGVEIAGVVWNPLYSGRVPDINVFGIIGGVEGDAEGMI